MSWVVVKALTAAGEHQHVMPVDDRRVHQALPTCWCVPKHDTEKPHVLIHNSVDRREMLEG